MAIRRVHGLQDRSQIPQRGITRACAEGFDGIYYRVFRRPGKIFFKRRGRPFQVSPHCRAAENYRRRPLGEDPAHGGHILPAPGLHHNQPLNTFSTSLSQSPNITYQLTSLGGTCGFADLGTGTFYGSRAYSADDSFELRSIALNQAAMNAIAAASGGSFFLGGRISFTVTFGAEEPNQLIFGGSDGPPQLIINYSEGGGPAETPEPASILLVATGLLGVAARSRR